MNRILFLALSMCVSTLAMEKFDPSREIDHIESERRSKRFKTRRTQTAPQGAIRLALPNPVKSLPVPSLTSFAATLFLEEGTALPKALNDHYDRHITVCGQLDPLPEKAVYFTESSFNIHLPKEVVFSMDDLKKLGNFLPKIQTLHISAKKFLGNASILKNRKIEGFLLTVQTNFRHLRTIGLGSLRSTDAALFQDQAKVMNWEIFITWEPYKSF